MDTISFDAKFPAKNKWNLIVQHVLSMKADVGDWIKAALR